MTKVFVDGSAGTTGLRICERLMHRDDVRLAVLPEKLRKAESARKDALNDADIAFLCLPDEVAKEAVKLVTNKNTVVIDTSTAHRTDDGFVYGFPELTGREKIKESKRISNPGCHASGFIALTAPLVRAGIVSKDALLDCFSMTGYSGGGKKMISEYEGSDRAQILDAPRMYALGQTHKHLAEMVKVTGLTSAPVFCPIVSDFYSGMQVTVPLFAKSIKGTAADIAEVYKETYETGLVKFVENIDENGFIAANTLEGKDSMHIGIYGNSERILLMAAYDNLGKGASGAAIQNMNIIMGKNEVYGLEI